MKKLLGKATISRNSNDIVTPQVRDFNSRNQFVSSEFTLEQYALLVTGLAEIQCNMEVKRLDTVGKIKISEERTITCPRIDLNKEQYRKWIKENFKDEGWEINAIMILSVNTKDGAILRFYVSKYVDPDSICSL